MATITFRELQDLFWNVTVSMTGLAAKYVRHAYQAQGQPAFKITENVAFINITPTDNPYDKQRDITYRSENSESVDAVEQVAYTEVFAVDFSLYGPNSFDLARDIKYKILTPSILETLSASGVFPIPAIPAPFPARYEFNNQWWERYDLRVLINVLTVRSGNVPYLTEATVTVKDAGGGEQVIVFP